MKCAKGDVGYYEVDTIINLMGSQWRHWRNELVVGLRETINSTPHANTLCMKVNSTQPTVVGINNTFVPKQCDYVNHNYYAIRGGNDFSRRQLYVTLLSAPVPRVESCPTIAILTVVSCLYTENVETSLLHLHYTSC